MIFAYWDSLMYDYFKNWRQKDDRKFIKGLPKE